MTKEEFEKQVIKPVIDKEMAKHLADSLAVLATQEHYDMLSVKDLRSHVIDICIEALEKLRQKK